MVSFVWRQRSDGARVHAGHRRDRVLSKQDSVAARPGSWPGGGGVRGLEPNRGVHAGRAILQTLSLVRLPRRAHCFASEKNVTGVRVAVMF